MAIFFVDFRRYIGQVPVHRTEEGHPRIFCDNIPGLDKKQRKLCTKYPNVMLSLRDGVKTGVKECQRQFYDNRWNCSILPRDPTVFGKSVLQSELQIYFH